MSFFPKQDQRCSAPICLHWATVRVTVRGINASAPACPGHASQVIKKLTKDHPGRGIVTEKIILPKEVARS